jgi:hypothetical protein
MSRDMVFEDVPRVSRRMGDSVQASANNATLLLGRDRMGSVDSGYGSTDSDGKGKGTGAALLVVGRLAEDPSFLDDRASLYLSAKSDPDAAADTASIGTEARAVSAALLRADCVRITSRTDFKVSVGKAYILIESSGRVVIEGDISLGKEASERLILADQFSQFWNTVTVPTPAGPSGPPPPLPPGVFSKQSKSK